MTLQNKEGLLPDIKSVGCLYLSLCRLVEFETEYGFSVNQINTIWEQSKKDKYIDKNNIMKEPDRVLKLFFQHAGKPFISFFQVGIHKQGREVFWGWVTDSWKNYKWMVEKVKTFGEVGTHFRLCNNKKELVYDSYSFTDYKFEKIEEYTLYARIK